MKFSGGVYNIELQAKCQPSKYIVLKNVLKYELFECSCGLKNYMQSVLLVIMFYVIKRYLFWNLYIFYLAFLFFSEALSEMIMLKSSLTIVDSAVYLS